jgi:hypothetical protein
MRTLALSLVIAVTPQVRGDTSPDPKRLAVPPEITLKAQELVGQLGSDEFTARESAHERLAKMGRLAKPALTTAVATHPDPEVRSRCRELLPKAAAEDMKARLDTFLADADGKYDHDLPGWNEFKKVAGTTAGSRELFTEMMNDPTNRAILMAFGSGADVGVLLANRKTEFYNWRFPRVMPNGVVSNPTRREPTPADITALLFAESFVESAKVPRTVPISTLFLSQPFSNAVRDGSQRGNAMRGVVVKWLETRDDPSQLSQAMSFASSLDLKEVAGVAAKVLAGGSTTPIRLNAALTIAKHDGKAHAPALEKALDDTAAYVVRTSVNGQLTSREIQVRDAALAALLLLSGQEPADYGFVEMYKGAGNMKFSYTNRTLPEDARKAAFEKWKAWRAKNPDWAKK